MKLICLIKTLYRTITSVYALDDIWISGHDFIEQDDGSLKCEICGRVSK